ncbi:MULTISPECIES: restriction endonuclease subunit S [Myxococcaceae]|uniref:restriction endonuclease subunit S n=1 Tax=Myxococcaceae TaxID=31 RepID=UPI00188F8A38|nr:restriction endonuclease subunit S [Simulacricoccus sp. 17bor-14]
MKKRECANHGGLEQNVLSLSYGRILRRDVATNSGLLPENFDSYNRVSPGDVVLRLTDLQNDVTSLRVGLVREPGIITSAYTTLSADPAKLISEWLFYLLHAYDARKVFYSLGGGVRQSAKFEDLRHLLVIVPPLRTQRSLTAFLDRRTAAIDSLLQKKERLLELMEEKRQALISHTVTKGLDPHVDMKNSGVAHFGKIPTSWQVLPLRRVIREFVDYRGRTPTKVDAGIPLITAGAIRDGRIEHSRAPEYMEPSEYNEFMSRGRPAVGDMVFTTEAPLGEVALVEDASHAFAQRVILFRMNSLRMTSKYLRLFYLSSPGRDEIKSRASGSTAEGIRADRLRGSAVIVPPVETQQLIAAELDAKLVAFEPLLRRLETQVARLREYRQALIGAAVTGQLSESVETEAA